MIFVDKPFVSDFLKKTIADNGFPVVLTDRAKELGFGAAQSAIDEESAIKKILSSKNLSLYTTSENAIGWIAKHLSATGLPGKIELFKDKAKFRALIKPLFPDFYFQEVSLAELDDLFCEDLPMPFIIKPTTGFFSMGVYKVSSPKEWPQVKRALHAEIGSVKALYPKEVLDTTTFIIEQCIEGEEFAVDAYYDAGGEPVVLGIYKHIFSSKEDVSDRVYMTSKEIIETNLESFSGFLKDIGTLAEVQNFPVHVEIRRDDSGKIIPIEINPMRFGGWCSTADMTCVAYGFNPYVYYFSQRRPNWKALLKNKEGKLYSIIVLDNSTGVDAQHINAFDFGQLLSRFEHPLELRKIDYKAYPVFGFLFAETSQANFCELERILTSDLKEFITDGRV
ncbi:MAG: ATP-grasp domain-containing protein [Desulfobacterales bacterium]|nr:ATP-grasp domain-containing protein [Desulfobacterales bacterium]